MWSRSSRNAPRRRARTTARARAEHRAQEVVQVEKLVRRVQATVLDQIMPNGQKLRFCRGSDCAAWGEGLSKLAALATDRGGPDCLIGEVICEVEAAALLGAAT
jgi:hypothetical protein